MRPPAVVVVAAAVALVLAGCGGGSGDGSAADTGFVAGDGSVRIVPRDKRSEPVALSADTLEGQRIDLAGLRGKPVVVNVWASWCKPCRKEASELAGAYTELRAQGVQFVGINTEDEVSQARAFERNFRTGYPSLVDEGTLLLAFKGAVPPSSVPTTLVLDPQGRIAARISGAVTRRTLVPLVRDATGLPEPAATPAATASAAG